MIEVPPPTILQLEVTKNCNFACIMCHKGQAVAKGSDFLRDNLSDIALKQITPIYPYLKHAMLFGDGEPMVYRNFWNIVRDIRTVAPECAIDFINNGSMMHYQNRQKVFDYNVSAIGLSIGGARAESHNHTRPPGMFHKIIDNYAALHREKLDRETLEPYVSALMVVMKSNYQEIPELVELCHSLGIYAVSLQKLFVTDSMVNDEIVSDVDVEPFIEEGSKRARQLGVGFSHYPLDSDGTYGCASQHVNRDDLIFKIKYTPVDNTGYCINQQPWNTVYVLHDGKVVPDCHWWGSVRNQRFNVCGVLDENMNILDIWNGEIYQGIRQRIASGKILPQCRGCGLAGGIKDEFRCAETDHTDPYIEKKLVQISLPDFISLRKNRPQKKEMFLNQRNLLEEIKELSVTDEQQKILLQADIGNYTAPSAPVLKRRHAWFVATPGLGEVILQTPIMRALHAEGYLVTLAARERLIPAFDDADFLHRSVPCSHEELKYDKDEVKLESKFIDEINDDSAIVVTPFRMNPDDIRGDVFCLGNPRDEYSSSLHSPVQGYASSCGIDPQDFELYVSRGFPVGLEGVNVGFCVGSFEIYRRFPDGVFEQLAKHLAKHFNIYLFGQDIETAPSGCHSVIDQPLKESLGYISAMDVFVTPDSGFLHAAIAMKIPTISIQSRECCENLVPPDYWKWVYHYGADDSALSCDKDCRAKVYEKNIRDDSRPSPKWSTLMHDVSPIYPFNLGCADDVQCLRLVDADKLTNLIKDVLKN